MPNIKNPNDLDYDYLESLHINKLYDNYSPKKIPSRMYEIIRISTDKSVIKLIDKQQKDLISLISGEKRTYHGQEFFEVQWTYSRSKKQGYLTYLFNLIIHDLGHKILSDKNHTTPGSKEFWKSQIRKSKFDIYRYDVKTNYKRNANKFKEDEIWGLTQSEQNELTENLAQFESFKGIETDNILEDSYFEQEINIGIEKENEMESDILSSFDDQFEEFIPEINKIEELVRSYKEKIKSKENIRLIAQKNIG